MTPSELFLLRLDHQGKFQPTDHIAQLLTTTVGMQAQQPRQTEVGIALRTLHATVADLQQTYQRQPVVRSWAQRWTHQLLTYTDWKMVIAARSHEQLPTAYYLGQKQLILDLATDLQTYLSQQTPLTKAEVNAFLDDATKEPLANQLCYAILQTIMNRGGAYFDPASSTTKYVIHAATPSELSPAAALEQLIPRYVAGFGPVEMADFVKWAGIRAALVRPVWERLKSQWVPIDYHGHRLYMTEPVSATHLAELVDQSTDQLLLTSGYDATMTGYVDKQWLVTPEHQSDLWTLNGILNPIMIINGQVAGTWKFQFKGRKIKFTLFPWHPLTATQQQRISTSFTHIAQFFNQTVGDISTQL